MQHVGHLLAAEAPTGVQIERDYDPSLPRLRLDRNQIIQALLNLARNAMQAVGAHGRIVLRTRALTNVSIGSRRYRVVVGIQVEDDGPGVPVELKDTVFYPLVTGRKTGTGLGLAVAQDLVGRHDGLIEFDSGPGRTVFTILLPFEANEPNTGLEVWIVDDDASIRWVLERALKQAGMTPSAFEDADSALSRAAPRRAGRTDHRHPHAGHERARPA